MLSRSILDITETGAIIASSHACVNRWGGGGGLGGTHTPSTRDNEIVNATCFRTTRDTKPSCYPHAHTERNRYHYD